MMTLTAPPVDVAPRVVSLIASATEIVAALGCRDWLVGRSHECDFPPDVIALPACSAARIDVAADSREIDRQVKAALSEGGGVYQLHASLLESLSPTVVLTQHQCDVCAVSLHEVEQAVCTFGPGRPQVVSLEPNSLADVWEDVLRVGRALQVPERAAALVERCQQRLRDLSDACQNVQRRQGGAQPRVACLEWFEPLMAAGNWVPELVAAVGGIDVLGAAGRPSAWVTWEALAAADPDVIVLMPCGFDLPRTLRERRWLAAHRSWSELTAVRNGRVAATDGNQYFNRPGPRLIESAEILAEILYPHQFDFGHRGQGWTMCDRES
jgi:iron complex transport system substrate-binding protein